MNDVTMRTLKLAHETDRPVIVCYMNDDGFSQRRVYIRKIGEGKITVYCTKARGLRTFREEGILSAQLAED